MITESSSLLLTGLSFSCIGFSSAQIPVLKESLKRESLPEEQAEISSLILEMVVPAKLYSFF